MPGFQLSFIVRRAPHVSGRTAKIRFSTETRIPQAVVPPENPPERFGCDPVSGKAYSLRSGRENAPPPAERRAAYRTDMNTNEFARTLLLGIKNLLSWIGIPRHLLDKLDEILFLVCIVTIAFVVAAVVHLLLVRAARKILKRKHLDFFDSLFRYSVFRKSTALIPPLIVSALLPFAFATDSAWFTVSERVTWIYFFIVLMISVNAILNTVGDTLKNDGQLKNRPIKGFIQIFQVIFSCVVVIVVVSILIDKSPVNLITGLGAFTAVLMLVFKDPILGLVAGVMISENDMLRIGDWIALPNNTANGTVEEITLNTVKIRNWDNTISTVPPYTLVNNSFQNWRGMQESGGRRVNKNIYLDMTTLKFCTPDMLDTIRKDVPLMADYQPAEGEVPTNAQLYRIYIERYLCSLPVVNQDLDLIISQKEPTTYGVPIQVYLFSRNTVWKEYERIQSDIFDHLLVMVGKFDLKLYQYSD